LFIPALSLKGTRSTGKRFGAKKTKTNSKLSVPRDRMAGPTGGVELSPDNELHLERRPQLTGCGKSRVTARMIKRH